MDILLSHIGFGLFISCIPIILSVYLFIVRKQETAAIIMLVVGAFLLRLFLISLDPFLHYWDEQFHALVAKNMISAPFKPMLRTHPILPYDYKAWCCNHIWVHKQPLFLWQMALSMKLFGINEITMRLPSALMGSISVFFTYQIAKTWLKDRLVSFIAALLMAVSYYQLELTSGRFSLDQNDVAFVFYVSASFWAFSRYIKKMNWRWAMIIGIFVGAAILNKWLTGLLVYAGWGLILLTDETHRFQLSHYKHILFSVIVAFMVFFPWQLYIWWTFPQETAWAFELNRQHISTALDGHSGNIFFYIRFLSTAYGKLLLLFIPFGLLMLWRKKKTDKKLTQAFLICILIIYLFFSVLVKTKMPAFTFPVSVLIFIIIALGFQSIFNWLIEKLFSIFKLSAKLLTLPYLTLRKYLVSLFLILIAISCLKPWAIAEYRSSQNVKRNKQVHNALVYKKLPDSIIQNYVILNLPSFKDIELMFYRNCNAFQWYPDAAQLDSLQHLGYKIAAFKSHGQYGLPDYIRSDTSIVIINDTLY